MDLLSNSSIESGDETDHHEQQQQQQPNAKNQQHHCKDQAVGGSRQRGGNRKRSMRMRPKIWLRIIEIEHWFGPNHANPRFESWLHNLIDLLRVSNADVPIEIESVRFVGKSDLLAAVRRAPASSGAALIVVVACHGQHQALAVGPRMDEWVSRAELAECALANPALVHMQLACCQGAAADEAAADDVHGHGGGDWLAPAPRQTGVLLPSVTFDAVVGGLGDDDWWNSGVWHSQVLYEIALVLAHKFRAMPRRCSPRLLATKRKRGSNAPPTVSSEQFHQQIPRLTSEDCRAIRQTLQQKLPWFIERLHGFALSFIFRPRRQHQPAVEKRATAPETHPICTQSDDEMNVMIK